MMVAREIYTVRPPPPPLSHPAHGSSDAPTLLAPGPDFLIDIIFVTELAGNVSEMGVAPSIAKQA